MNSKSAIAMSVLCAIAFSGASSAATAAEFDDFARVVRVQPQVEQFNQPQQDCRTEYVPAQRSQQQQRSIGGSIVGGLAGGLLGNQVGGGTGRAVATAAGAITGAIVGDRMENNSNYQPQYAEQAVRQCRTVDNWQARTTGYVVTYEYRGRDYTSVMPYDPGERVKLHVSLTPR